MSSGYEGVLHQKGIKPELVGKLGKCGHMYHLLCLVAMYNNGNKVCKISHAIHHQLKRLANTQDTILIMSRSKIVLQIGLYVCQPCNSNNQK